MKVWLLILFTQGGPFDYDVFKEQARCERVRDFFNARPQTIAQCFEVTVKE